MPLPDLTEDEHAELVHLLRDAIAAEPYRIGPRMSKLQRLVVNSIRQRHLFAQSLIQAGGRRDKAESARAATKPRDKPIKAWRRPRGE
jgi:hypothetical protein